LNPHRSRPVTNLDGWSKVQQLRWLNWFKNGKTYWVGNWTWTWTSAAPNDNWR
jgi:hypothetical protein